MHTRSIATERLIMTVVCFATAAAPAAAQIDVEVRLIPVESPSGSDVVPDVGSLPSNTLILNRSVTPEFFLEVWVSDVGTVNTGVISAYFDVTCGNGNLTDAIGTACSALFNLLCEGTIENGINQVTNFGGTDGSFQGQGVEPVFARVGQIHYSALDDGELTFDATVGLGEVGVLNRSVGDVAIIGANVIIGSCLTDEDCLDQNLCNGQETCDVESGQCAPGTPLECPDDGNQCTDTTCDPVSGCGHVPNNDPCDDGDDCTDPDICSGGECIGEHFCEPGEVCVDGICVPDGCQEGDPCDDGDACTDDSCIDGNCVNEPIDCNDNNTCTNDSCADGGCINDEIECPPGQSCVDGECVSQCPQGDPCDDGDACTEGSTCDAGGNCVGGTPIDCSAEGDQCNTASCDPNSEEGNCDNLNPVEDGTTCDDNNACTTADSCVSGVCTGGPPPGCDDGNVCNGEETCDPSDGCRPGTPLDCDDGNICTEDFCDSDSGCNHDPIPGSCDDEDACTEDDTCVEGECLGTAIPGCMSTFLDIMPRTCPNSLRRQGGGNLDVALIGTGEFDPQDVDISSLLLARADGVGGDVAPRSHPAPSFRDRATPFLGDLCDCHEDGADGIDDLFVKFSKSDVVDVLNLDALPADTELVLALTGTLLDGTPFSASDCILLAPPRGGGPPKAESPEPGEQPIAAPEGSDGNSSSATCGFGGLAALLMVTGLSLLRSRRNRWERPRKP